MPHQNRAGPDHRGDGGEAQSSVLGWLATATDSRPHTKLQLVRADLVGADTAVAAGITATGHAPLLTLCRRLVEAGHNPSTPLEAYRGTTLCLRARSIGAGARLTVRRRPRRQTPLRDLPSRSRWPPELRGSAAHAFKRWGGPCP
jgi:hypothetical protein